MRYIKLLLALLLIGNIALAQKPAAVLNDKEGWHKITEVVARFEKETDEVDVLLANRFASLKFKVVESPIELVSLEVFFEGGEKQTITIGKKIKKAGESSKEIKIKGGGEKNIDRVILKYRTVEGAAKKGRLEIWGKKTNAEKKNKKKAKSGKPAEEKPARENSK